jgi:hypothetical protein
MTKPLNYLPCDPSDKLFEQVVSATILEIASNGRPGEFIDEAVDAMRYEFDHTRAWLRKLERGAARLNPFGCFRLIRFRRAVGVSV